MMQWKSGQEFVRPVYTSLSGPNVRLLEQADRVSNTTPEPGINGSPKIPPKSSVRMLIISTSSHRSRNLLSLLSVYPDCRSSRIYCIRYHLFVIALSKFIANNIISNRSISVIFITLNTRIRSVCAC